MHLNQHAKNLTIFTVILLILALFTVLPTPKVLADVTISTLSPIDGPVGAEVSLTGQITEVNGSYKIFFDDTLVKSGHADPINVFDIFIVPNATSGSHVVTLHDVTREENSTANFTVQTEYKIESTTPFAQEGANITVLAAVTGGNPGVSTVNITITDPANTTHSLINREMSVGDQGNFTQAYNYLALFDQNPHTFFAGTYDMLLTRHSTNLAEGAFTIGLTNSKEYHRFQTVNVQALNYTPTDILRIRITHQDDPVFESNFDNATGPQGKITANWAIPANASLGLYKAEVEMSSGTPKPVPENQSFTIVSKSFACDVKTVNLDDEPIEGIVVEANNTFSSNVFSNTTRQSGVTSFYIEATNYTFATYLNDTQVGSTTEISLSKNLTETLALEVVCSLAHLEITVEDETHNLLPFVDISANFTHTTRANANISRTAFTQTNLTGRTTLRNLFTNINYTVKSSRYGSLFDATTLNLTSSSEINITCPTLVLVVRALNRTRSPLPNAQIRIYDWSIGLDGLMGEGTTNQKGEFPINLTFGRYLVKVYKDGSELNETNTLVNNLTHPTTFIVHCRLYNLMLSVNVLDYFGQGIPNANVTIEREGKWIVSSPTSGNGVAQFVNLIGGNYKIFVSVAEKPYRTTGLYLQDPEVVTLKVGEVVSVAGFITETPAFITAVFLLLLTLAISIPLIYRRLRPKQKID
ncbi:MAG: carboxypeptidase regulatory-like domain-containing protein [Candidatus Bathyarchaeota archaeon]|nr:MAG: carboxypeptidase regulatory-like domain-containing protein [Candidatus Bathyarchaeota archaeon]